MVLNGRAEPCLWVRNPATTAGGSVILLGAAWTPGIATPGAVLWGYTGDGNATAFQTPAILEGLPRAGASSDTAIAPAMTGERHVC